MHFKQIGTAIRSILLVLTSLWFGQALPQTSDTEILSFLNRQNELLAQGHHQLEVDEAANALSVAEKRIHKDDYELVVYMSAMVDAYHKLEKYDKALPLMLRSQELLSKLHGSESLIVATYEAGLAWNYFKLSQFQNSLSHYQHALFVKERLLGPDHAETIACMYSLALNYFNLNQFDKALPLYERVLAFREKTFGPDHIDTTETLLALAVTFSRLNKDEQSLPLNLRALEIREKMLGTEHIDTATALYHLALTYSRLNQHEKALPLNLRAVDIRERGLGSEHVDTIASLRELATNYFNLNQPDKALPLYQRVLTVREKAFGTEHTATANNLIDLATTYGQLNQDEKALPLNLRAVEIREKMLGPEHIDTATALFNLAANYSRLNQHVNALPLNLHALEIREKNLGPEHADTISSLYNLAANYTNLNQPDKALPLNVRVLAAREKMLGHEHTDTATSLANLAGNHRILGQLSEALPLYQRSLALSEKIYGIDQAKAVSDLTQLAHVYSDLAQLDKALPLLKKALSISEKYLGPEHPDTVSCLSNLLSVYDDLAQYEKVLPLIQRVLEIMERTYGSESQQVAGALKNLGSTYANLGDPEKALPFVQRSLSIRENGLGYEHPDTALSLNSLAGIYSHLHQYDKALQVAERALEIHVKFYGHGHPLVALSLNRLAGIYIELGQNEKALPHLQRALSIKENVFGLDHPSTAWSLKSLAYLFDQEGRHELAVGLLKSVVNTLQSQREQVSRIGSIELQSYTESVSSVYQKLAGLLVDQGRLSEAQQVLDMIKEDEQFDFVSRSKVDDPRSTRIGYNLAEKAWVERYRLVSGRLAALGSEVQALQKQAKLGLSIDQQKRKRKLEADLLVAQRAFDLFLNEMRISFVRSGSARASDIAELKVNTASDMPTLIKGLGHDAVLLQYYITNDQVGMLLTTPGVQLARSTKVDSNELNRKIGEFRRLLRDPKSNLLPASQALYQLLVAPVAQDLEQAGAKTVMLSLDGALRYLPFGALHDGNRFLVERWNLPMYTSVTKSRLQDAVSPQWKVAGLGVSRSIGEFPALPAVKAEMDNIVNKAAGGLLSGEVHLDEDFTALRLKDVSNRAFQLLHVASHFRFSPGTEVNSFLLLGDGQHLTLGDIRTQNYRFDNVDLLTLSACDTGLGGGRDAQGREIEGFGVIAQQQGAKAVLATLWPVADQSTATLMVNMYRSRQDQHLTKTEALRQAQISLMHQKRYAHPFYWAPFILMGNWL